MSTSETLNINLRAQNNERAHRKALYTHKEKGLESWEKRPFPFLRLDFRGQKKTGGNANQANRFVAVASVAAFARVALKITSSPRLSSVLPSTLAASTAESPAASITGLRARRAWAKRHPRGVPNKSL